MKILLLCTSAEGGGAARAALSLLYALRNGGADARLLTLFPYSKGDNPYIDSVFHGRWGLMQANVYKSLERLDIIRHNAYRPTLLWRFSSASVAPKILEHPWFDWAEIVHLHWVNHGLLSLQTLQTLISGSKPIVWTLHDLWPATGGCHLPLVFRSDGISVCPQYDQGCTTCPLLHSSMRLKGQSYSSYILAEKRKWKQDNVSYIAVSRRAQKLFERSFLSKELHPRIVTIAPPLTYISSSYMENDKPRPEWYNPEVNYLLLVAARIDDPVKGVELLVEMTRHLKTMLTLDKYIGCKIELLLVGSLRNKLLLDQIAIPVHHLGSKSGEELQQIYRLSSVCLSTSIFETFGLTLLESLSQGTPVVSFCSYGPEDVVLSGINGYLVPDYNPSEMASAVLQTLEDWEDGKITEETCKSSIASFSEKNIALQHLAYYRDLIASREI